MHKKIHGRKHGKNEKILFMVQRRSKKQIPRAISPFIWGYLIHLKKQGIPIKNAYLFGSWAKGTQHQDSDIDVAIISSKFTNWTKTYKLLTSQTRLDFADIESHGFHPKQFNSKTNPVAHEILKYGIKIM